MTMEAKERELRARISLVKEQKEKRYGEYFELVRKHSELEDAVEAAVRTKEEVVAKHNTAEKKRRDGLTESLVEMSRLLCEEKQCL
jgi:predicted nuclease with TOPRIM domain